MFPVSFRGLHPADTNGLWERQMYLCVCEDVRRNDLFGSESLSGVNEGGQYLCTLPALRYSGVASAFCPVGGSFLGGRGGLTSHRRWQWVVDPHLGLVTSIKRTSKTYEVSGPSSTVSR